MPKEHADIAKLDRNSQMTILGLLLLAGTIDKAKKKNVISALSNHQESNDLNYSGLDEGQVAIKMNYATEEDITNARKIIAISMANSAVQDIQDIANGKKLTLPDHLVPDWKNSEQRLTPESAASAAANVAKLITLLAKDNQDLARSVQPGVIAAKNLTNYILGGNSARYPGNQRAVEWLIDAQRALYTLAKDEPRLEQYIENRFSKIIQGATMAEAMGQEAGRQPSNKR